MSAVNEVAAGEVISVGAQQADAANGPSGRR